MFRVLLIDDEPMILAHTRSLIDWRAIGCEIAGCAGSCPEGWELIGRLAPDLVITDVVMPGGSGLDLVDRYASESCRFIILSGYQEFEYAQHALRSGAVDYLLKPVMPSELQASVMRVLRTDTAAASPEKSYGSLVNKVIRSINEHYMEDDFSLSWICNNEIFMNETYVGRQFLKQTGVKFTAWVTEKRISEAKRLLVLRPEMTMAEIAGRVGFMTSKYFTEVFKKNTGLSPSQYRNAGEAAESQENGS